MTSARSRYQEEKDHDEIYSENQDPQKLLLNKTGECQNNTRVELQKRALQYVENFKNKNMEALETMIIPKEEDNKKTPGKIEFGRKMGKQELACKDKQPLYLQINIPKIQRQIKESITNPLNSMEMNMDDSHDMNDHILRRDVHMVGSMADNNPIESCSESDDISHKEEKSNTDSPLIAATSKTIYNAHKVSRKNI